MNGKIKLTYKVTKTIAKALMCWVDPTKNVFDYTSLYKVVEWLETVDNWEDEMEQLDRGTAKKRLAAHKPLSVSGQRHHISN